MTDFLDLSKGRLVPGTDRDSSDFAVPLGASSSPDFAERTLGKRPPTAATPSGGQGLRLDANSKMPRRLTMLDVFNNGTRVNALPRSILNFVGASSIADNPHEDRVDVGVTPAPTMISQWCTAQGDSINAAAISPNFPVAIAAGATVLLGFDDSDPVISPPNPLGSTYILPFTFGAANAMECRYAGGASTPQSLWTYFFSFSVLWENANYQRWSRIVAPLSQGALVGFIFPQVADMSSDATSGVPDQYLTGAAAGFQPQWQKSTMWVIPKTTGLQVQFEVTNGDVVPRHILAAYAFGFAMAQSSAGVPF